eukprot:gene4105-8161_t
MVTSAEIEVPQVHMAHIFSTKGGASGTLKNDDNNMLNSGSMSSEPLDLDLVFSQLMQKLDVPKQRIESMTTLLSQSEKASHIKTGQSVLNDDIHFSASDEDMMTALDVQRYIDSVRLLTLKKRIFAASKDWMKAFCSSGGISVLVENIDNRLTESPKRESTASALFELLQCMREVMKTDGLSVAIGTRGAVDAIVLSLDFDYKALGLQVVHAMRHLAKVRNEKPFAVLVSALESQDIEVQAAVMEFIATLVMSDIDLQERMSLRNDLQQLNFQQVYMGILTATSSTSASVSASLGRDDISSQTPRKNSLVTKTHKPVAAAITSTSTSTSTVSGHHHSPKVSSSSSTSNTTTAAAAGPSSSSRVVSSSHNSRTRDSKGSGGGGGGGAGVVMVNERDEAALLNCIVAEDGSTAINPCKGLMAGTCLHDDDSGQSVKRRWYRLEDGVLSWWLPHSKGNALTGSGPLGRQDMYAAVEVLSYSSGTNLQEMNQFNLEVVLMDGKHIRLGVANDVLKCRWVTALTASMEEANRRRVAYRKKKAFDKFRKQVSLYEAVVQEDHALVHGKGMGATGADPVEIARLLYYEMNVDNRGQELVTLLQALATIPSGDISRQLWAEILALCGCGDDDGIGNGYDVISTGGQSTSMPPRSSRKKKQITSRSATCTPVKGYEDTNGHGNGQATATVTGHGHGRATSAFEAVRLRSQMKSELTTLKSQLSGMESELSDLRVENDSLRKKLKTYQDGGGNGVKSKWKDSVFMARIFAGKKGDSDSDGNVKDETHNNNGGTATTTTGTIHEKVPSPRKTTGTGNEDTGYGVVDAKSRLLGMLVKKDKKKDTQKEKGKTVGKVSDNDGGRNGTAAATAVVTDANKNNCNNNSNSNNNGNSNNSERGSSGSLPDSNGTAGGYMEPPPPRTPQDPKKSTTTIPEEVFPSPSSTAKSNLFELLKQRTARSAQKTQIHTQTQIDDVHNTVMSVSSNIAAVNLLLPPLPPPDRGSGSVSGLSVAVPHPIRRPLVPPPLPGALSTDCLLSSLPPKPVMIPSVKMKAVFWTKLKVEQLRSSIWLTLQEPKLCWTELEELFGEDVAMIRTKSSLDMGTSGGGGGGGAHRSVHKSKTISLFDNVSIACGKIRRAPKDIANMIVHMDPLQLTKDLTETLLPLVPTTDELTLINAFEGPKTDLDLPGKLFLELNVIPRLPQRLRFQLTTFTWPEDADKLSEDLDLVLDAVEEMRQPEAETSMRTVLSMALAVGNYMNGGTSRGQAYGVRIEILLKLGNIKETGGTSSRSSKSKYGTLLRYMAAQLQSHYPDALEVLDTCTAVWRAAKISLQQLESDLTSLSNDLKAATAEYEECKRSIESVEMRNPVLTRLDMFVRRGTIRVGELRDKLKEASEGVSTLRQFYGEADTNSTGTGTVTGTSSTTTSDTVPVKDPKDQTQCPSQQFFSFLTQFISSLKRAVEENTQRQEQMRKEELNRLAAEKRMLARGATNKSRISPSKSGTGTEDVFAIFREAQEQSTDSMIAMFKARMTALNTNTGDDSFISEMDDIDKYYNEDDDDDDDGQSVLSEPMDGSFDDGSLTWRTTGDNDTS